MRRIFFHGWLLLALFPLTAQSQQEARGGSEHGTCAVFMQNGENDAFVIDSVTTLLLESGSVAGTKLTCKVWPQRPSMIAAILGRSAIHGVWNGQESARSALERISNAADGRQVDTALKHWSSELLGKLQGTYKGPDGLVSLLFVAYRVEGHTYVALEEVDSLNHKPRLSTKSVRVLLHPDDFLIQNFGVCDDFLQIDNLKMHGSMSHPDSEQLERLLLMAASTNVVHSSSELGNFALSVEKSLVDITKKYGDKTGEKIEVGPPYQLATLEAGSEQWVTKFEPPCAEPAAPAAAPLTRRTSPSPK